MRHHFFVVSSNNTNANPLLLDDFDLTDFSTFPGTASAQLATLHQLPQSQPYDRLIAPSTNVSRSPSVSLGTRTGEKRKAVDVSADAETPVYADEVSRAAAEEDKRRRNTAASARFRVKKKQREQAMEKTAKDMTDRVTFLENRVIQLEMENKLLKDLVTEKGVKDSDNSELENKAAQATVESSRAGARKGVGTAVKIE